MYTLHILNQQKKYASWLDYTQVEEILLSALNQMHFSSLARGTRNLEEQSGIIRHLQEDIKGTGFCCS